MYDYCFLRRFYAVTSRYNTASYGSNSNSGSVKLKHQRQQQQFLRNDKPTSQLTTQYLHHPDNGDVAATAADRQYFILDPEQQ